MVRDEVIKMVRIKRSQSDSFTIVDNKFVREENLSWKARGIFMYLYAQADDWNFYEAEVALHATDGKDSLRSGLQELEKFGYLRRERGRKQQGKFTNMVWELTMNPHRKQVRQPKAPTEGNGHRKVVNLKNPEKPPYEQIIMHLNAKTGRQYNPMTKATVEIIDERLNEGYQVDDFIKVIDTKVQHWLHDERFSLYLRPTTLFSDRFDSYMNETFQGSKQVGLEEAWYE